MRKFTDKERKDILSYAEKHGVAEAAEKFDIRKNYIYRWRSTETEEPVVSSRGRRGRKPAGEVNLESLKVTLQEKLKEVERIKAIIAYLETGKV